MNHQTRDCHPISKNQQQRDEIDYMNLVSYQLSDGFVSFEGEAKAGVIPKPKMKNPRRNFVLEINELSITRP